MRADLEGVLEVCREAEDLEDLMRRAMSALRRVVPFDACGLRTVDPETLLWTGAYVDGAPGIKWRFIENEVLEDDFLKFGSLARGPVAGTLFTATGGQPSRSRRYRTILADVGMCDELRAALVTRNVCWGTLCISRSEDSGLFTEAERDLVATIAPSLSQALCRRIVSQAAVSAFQGPPGTLLVRGDGTIAASTAVARRWLSKLAVEPADPLPPVARGVVARARACAAGSSGMGASARTRTRRGGWFELHGEALIDQPDLISLTIAPAPIARIAPLLLAGFELSAREEEVVALILRGLSIEQIAGELFISRHTVRDHTKSIFAKAHVSSRNQLVALLLANAEPLIG